MASGVRPPSPLFEQLLRHVGKTRQLARSLLGDESAAEDAVQETWVSASRRPPPEAPGPWLGVALRNRLLNRAREERRRVAREEQTPPAMPPASPEELLARLEMHRKLVEAVARLAEPYRQAVLLRYFEELSSSDIGARLGIPAATVRGRLKTALDLLREDLDRAPGGRKAWVGAMVLVAGGARHLGPGAVGAVTAVASQGSSMLVKLLVALTAAGAAGTVIVVRAPRPQSVAPVARAQRLPPARFERVAPAEAPSPPPSAPPVTAGSPSPREGTPSPAPTASPARTYALAGWVQLGEPAPQPARIDVSSDPSCPPRRDEEVLVGEKGSLANVVIRVLGPGPSATPPAIPVVIRQHDCNYYPRVSVAEIGQPIQIHSTDQVVHPARAYADGRSIGDGPLALGTPVIELAATRAGEVVRLACDRHPWMTAKVVVADTPWHSVTEGNGRFVVGEIPAGSYKVEAWHERYGTQRAQFWVGPGQPLAVLNFVFGKEWQPAGGETTGTGWPAVGDGCRIAVTGASPVVKACKEGGIKKAKSVMKSMVKRGKEAGLKLECDDCHKDEAAGNWSLKANAEQMFKRLSSVQ
jgi:RNA polymerase sigma factor (sigma-70 family)